MLAEAVELHIHSMVLGRLVLVVLVAVVLDKETMLLSPVRQIPVAEVVVQIELQDPMEVLELLSLAMQTAIRLRQQQDRLHILIPVVNMFTNLPVVVLSSSTKVKHGTLC
jgi:hypothetical protein